MIQLLAGDCRDVLPTLAADSVQTVVTSPPYYALRSYLPDGHADKGREIGSEPTPDEYLATMVGVFREVRRVLRPDGTCWVNMGDSFSSGNGVRSNNNGTGASSLMADGRAEDSRVHSLSLTKTIGMKLPPVDHGLAAKQLLMMPARLALALQADGWWLRSDIIWHKPNPMPESVTDRPTSAHEHVFLLTKRSRYFYDADAVREEAEIRDGRPHDRQRNVGGRTDGYTTGTGGAGFYAVSGRSCRNVWTIATHAYPQAHFATYPPELAERCIRAGTSERGACSQCGAPWARVTSKEFTATSGPKAKINDFDRDQGWEGVPRGYNDVTTTGWQPSCECGPPPWPIVPCTVLDPFAGAGTTLLVADRLQRDAIGIELSPDYTRLAMQRCQDDAPLFTSFPPASDDTYDSGMRDLFREAAD